MNTLIPKKKVHTETPAESPASVKAPQEQIRTQEKFAGAEKVLSETVVASESKKKQAEVSTRAAHRVTSVQPKIKADRLSKEIEDILAEDLTDLYLAMPPAKQQEFKIKGEETASKVREFVRAAKINAKKIFQLIRDWLRIVPGVNRFFLEQEAKIKTDKILLVSEEEKKRNETV